MLHALLLAILAGTPAAPAPGGAAHAATLYAALPLRNMTADAAAPEELMARVRHALESRGASFVPGEQVEQFLRARRVRYADSLSVEHARALQQTLGAQHVLLGALFEFTRGEKPHLALSLRVLDAATGRREQSVVVSMRGEDSKRWLGLGAIEDVDALAELALEKLLGIFGADGAPLRPAAPRTARDAEDEPGAGGRARFDLPAGTRLALLPFVNRSTRLEASPQFTEVLANEWFRCAQIEVVEASELRAAMIREKIRYLHDLDPKALIAVGRAAGVRYFVFGSLDSFGEEQQVGQAQFPVVEATLRLVDAELGRVVASSSIRVRGDVHRQFLDFGLTHDPLVVAAEAARRLLDTL